MVDHLSASTAEEVVMRLRPQRHSLARAVRELRTWIDLLRHKALALRALNQARGETESFALNPGSLDQQALGEALADQPLPLQRRRNRPLPPPVGADTTADLLRRAQVLWDVVADPEDPLACQDLAAAADRLADRLELRWRDTREEWRVTGEQLADALAPLQAAGESHRPSPS